ncbi:ULP1A [Scenedesmus sp. PABB004]|nr:ULP1A [Scenedesmus sp. PABB004]
MESFLSAFTSAFGFTPKRKAPAAAASPPKRPRQQAALEAPPANASRPEQQPRAAAPAAAAAPEPQQEQQQRAAPPAPPQPPQPPPPPQPPHVPQPPRHRRGPAVNNAFVRVGGGGAGASPLARQQLGRGGGLAHFSAGQQQQQLGGGARTPWTPRGLAGSSRAPPQSQPRTQQPWRGAAAPAAAAATPAAAAAAATPGVKQQLVFELDGGGGDGGWPALGTPPGRGGAGGAGLFVDAMQQAARGLGAQVLARPSPARAGGDAGRPSAALARADADADAAFNAEVAQLRARTDSALAISPGYEPNPASAAALLLLQQQAIAIAAARHERDAAMLGAAAASRAAGRAAAAERGAAAAAAGGQPPGAGAPAPAPAPAESDDAVVVVGSDDDDEAAAGDGAADGEVLLIRSSEGDEAAGEEGEGEGEQSSGAASSEASEDAADAAAAGIEALEIAWTGRAARAAARRTRARRAPSAGPTPARAPPRRPALRVGAQPRAARALRGRRGPGRDGEAVAKLRGAPLSRRDLRTLSPGSWLNDEVINAYLGLLQERDTALRASPRKGGADAAGGPPAPRCHFFSSFFLPKLAGPHFNGYAYKDVRRWTLPARLKAAGQASECVLRCDRLLLPVNENNTHWTAVMVDLPRRRIVALDSLHGRNTGVVAALRRWLADEAKDKLQETWDTSPSAWAEEYPGGIPRQANGYDCGVFALLFLDRLGAGAAFDFEQPDMPAARVRIACALLDGAALPAPSAAGAAQSCTTETSARRSPRTAAAAAAAHAPVPLSGPSISMRLCGAPARPSARPAAARGSRGAGLRSGSGAPRPQARCCDAAADQRQSQPTTQSQTTTQQQPGRRALLLGGAAAAIAASVPARRARAAAPDLRPPALGSVAAPDQGAYDAADPALREAAGLLQRALNAETVTEEEALWSEVIDRFGSADAPWVPDVVGRAYGNRGNARSRQGKLAAALSDYNAAMELCPWSVDPILNRGVALEALGRPAQPRPAQVAPPHARAAGTAGAAAGAAGMQDWAEAERCFGRAAALAPNFSFASANRSLALFQLGRRDEATRQMRSLLRRYPDFVDMRAALAGSLWAAGLEGAAESEWERVDDPRYRDVAWLARERRWPPALVDSLQALLTLKSI